VAWVILLLVLLAAAFGVLGAVLKAAAFLVLTILLTLAVLGAIAWYGIKGQLRRWNDEVRREQRASIGEPRSRVVPRDLPSHDDRY
jgi:hypothetical protein